MKKEDVLGELDGNNSTGCQMLMNFTNRVEEPLALRILSLGMHNMLDAKPLNEECSKAIILTPPRVPMYLMAIGNGVALAVNGQKIPLQLEQEALAPVFSAIIALSKNHASDNQIHTDEELLQKQENEIETLRKLFLNSWPRQGSLKSRRKKTEFAGPGRNLDEGWTPQTVAELFDGRITEAIVRYYARQLANLKVAGFNKPGKGFSYTWNLVQVIKLLNHMNMYCPTVRKMKIKNIQQLFDNFSTN